MKIENMRYIVEVSKYKSINKASQHLFMNQRQLSRIIAMTEEELDMKIFERTPRGVFMTQEGREIVKKFELILSAYDSLKEVDEAVKDRNLSGKIRIFSDVSIWHGLVSMGEEFIRRYPQIGFSLESMTSARILEQLEADDGYGEICRVWHGDEADLAAPDALDYHVLAHDRLEVFGRPENPIFRQYKTISLASLLEHPLVVYRPHGSGGQSVVDRIFAPVGAPMIRYEVVDFRVFWTILNETDCLFLAMRRPPYLPSRRMIGIPVRDEVQLEYGIVCNPGKKQALYDAFGRFHQAYYNKLQES